MFPASGTSYSNDHACFRYRWRDVTLYQTLHPHQRLEVYLFNFIDCGCSLVSSKICSLSTYTDLEKLLDQFHPWLGIIVELLSNITPPSINFIYCGCSLVNSKICSLGTCTDLEDLLDQFHRCSGIIVELIPEDF